MWTAERPLAIFKFQSWQQSQRRFLCEILDSK
jgi:hypothetical protein